VRDAVAAAGVREEQGVVTDDGELAAHVGHVSTRPVEYAAESSATCAAFRFRDCERGRVSYERLPLVRETPVGLLDLRRSVLATDHRIASAGRPRRSLSRARSSWSPRACRFAIARRSFEEARR
jgi:hypothetical protein